MWVNPFVERLREALRTGLASDWLLLAEKDYLLAGLPVDNGQTTRLIVLDDAADQRVFSVISGFGRSRIPAMIRTQLTSPSIDEMVSVVSLMWAHPLSDWLLWDLGTGLVSNRQLRPGKCSPIRWAAGLRVAEWSAWSPPTETNRFQSAAGLTPDFRMWKSYRTMPLLDHPHRLSRPRPVSLLSPATESNRVKSPAGSLPDSPMWELCWTMPLIGGFSRESPVSPALSFRCCSTLITLIESQDHAVKSRPNIFTIFMIVFTHAKILLEVLLLTNCSSWAQKIFVR
ncbi:hypothetical protein PR048_007721 [Dryococelus australis]|uniref:Uncharacterized protein n=1 Tax=Dryococelus australis TaxID=614101 RepID=A0ABQ9HVX4_9NEOP|nr:hypothetical protein PR048_007721 [Dryococelus australis]